MIYKFPNQSQITNTILNKAVQDLRSKGHNASRIHKGIKIETKHGKSQFQIK